MFLFCSKFKYTIPFQRLASAGAGGAAGSMIGSMVGSSETGGAVVEEVVD